MMPSYQLNVVVPDGGAAHSLGSYEADYLPRVGDRVVLWHPRVMPRPGVPVMSTVERVMHEMVRTGTAHVILTHVYVTNEERGITVYCTCTEGERRQADSDAILHGSRAAAAADMCSACYHARRPAPWMAP
jgi:hypothetical protein